MSRTRSTRLPALALSCALTIGAGALPQQPAAVTPEGGERLPRAAEAARTHLLGLVDIYTLAIYADASPSDPAQLASSGAAKALRIDIRYEETAGLRRRVPADWWRELVPALEPSATTHLRRAFAALRRGDVVLVEYVPAKGTTVRVNRTVAVEDANHDLMVAFLDHWLGQQPVSEAMKRALLGS
jgi:hypothetical protein